ncbi:ComF family protein [Aquabacter cavernae]|uniref:ComF family protein n=1 Tax=Aquabacter cavernae TaxID=2496029 RepID=UPI000F8C8CAA|nr:ComF family protein [Aquabacter cavernae]
MAPAARRLRAAGHGLLDLVLPPTCISCGAIVRDAGGLCGGCWGRLALISPPVCERLGTPFPYAPPNGAPLLSPDALADPPAFDRARAAVLFGPVSRDLVHHLKYGDRLDLARPMARLMRQAGAPLLGEADLIVPVPLHALRLWRRRFNQAALLARHLSALTELPVALEGLARTRATLSQVNLSRAERRANVAGAFRVSKTAEGRVAGRRVLLVDDVFTTGATLDACARALRRAGASHVDAVTFARVVEQA